MWKCRECGEEINIKAVIKGVYPVFLDKNKKIIDHDGFDILDVPNSDIQGIYCGECGKWCNSINELEKIATWED